MSSGTLRYLVECGSFLRRRVPARVTLVLSAITFAPALSLPFFWMVPGFGDPILEGLLEVLFGQTFAPYAYSVLGGIVVLYRDGEWLIATVLLLFSVVFPIVKLVLLFLSLPPVKGIKIPHALIQRLGPWSMADVFVVSLTIIASKSFPGGTRIYPGLGYYCFLVSVVLAIISSYQLSSQTQARAAVREEPGSGATFG